jgi:hypothetical protein
MTKPAAGSSENPESTDDLVRDLEESGYPVDGATELFVPQPDGLALGSERPGSPPVPPDSAHEISTTPSENRSANRADVEEQGEAANIA